MKEQSPIWWGDIQPYFVVDKETYKRTLREDCPKDLREKYEEYERQENKK
ncbi:MAG: hypothetical protein ACRCX2_04425 [Paraclostridium sp.]